MTRGGDSAMARAVEDSPRLTASVQHAVRASGEKDPVSTLALVKHLLGFHSEYGGGRATQIAESIDEVEGLELGLPGQLVDRVAELFDPQMGVTVLHGRLLILGLCVFDDVLRRQLDGYGLLAALRAELREDFDSLLLPQHTGDRAYRNAFMKLLQNRASRTGPMVRSERTASLSSLRADRAWPTWLP